MSSIETLLQSSVLALLGLGAAWLARRASAATRRFVLLASLAAILGLPLARAVAPRSELAPLASLAAAAPPIVDDPVLSAGAELAASTAPSSVLGPSGTANAWPSGLWNGLWLGGFTLLALRALWARRRGAWVAQRAAVIAAPLAREELESAAARLGIRAPELRASSELEVPAVVGFLRPVVLVPTSALDWDRARWQSVLSHELAHISSHDVWVHAASDLVVALHWANPLVWLLARRLRFEQELAADDRVLDAGVRASAYATHLLEAVRDSGPEITPALVRRSTLGRRIEALLDGERRRMPLTALGRGAFAVGALALLGVVACAAPSESETGPADVASAPPRAGATTLVPAFQAIAESEIARIAREHDAAAATVIVLDPRDGAILALANHAERPGTDVARHGRYVPGSTFKVLAVAAALEAGVVRTEQRFPSGRRAYGDQSLRDVSQEHGELSLGEVLAVSSNVGISYVFDALGPERYASALSRFRIETEQPVMAGLPGVMTALGQKLPLAPLAIAAIYATIANGGRYNAPTLERPARPENQRVLSAETTRTVMAMLEGVVTSERGTGTAARIPGVRVAGKTGSADSGAGRQYGSFAGIVPADAPRWVVFVGIDGPRPGVSGGRAAAPAFARIARRLLDR